MRITVKKPTDAEREKMLKLSTWGCEVSEFDWFYSQEETCLLTAGEVTVTYDGGETSFAEGDLVTFPQGLSCVWKVTKPVHKHYFFK